MRVLLVFGVTAAALGSFAGPQISTRWTFDRLASRSDLVVIAEPGAPEVVGRHAEHPELRSLPVIELSTTLTITAVLKPDAATARAPSLRVRHYRIDWDEWRRRNPQQPGLPPPGVVNTGSTLAFGGAGPYLLFLTRAEDGAYEPASGHTFPHHSAYRLQELGPTR
jgi:hypothetical protein